MKSPGNKNFYFSPQPNFPQNDISNSQLEMENINISNNEIKKKAKNLLLEKNKKKIEAKLLQMRQNPLKLEFQDKNLFNSQSKKQITYLS